MRKIIFGLIVLSLLSIGLLFKSDLKTVSANPDYICIMDIPDQGCETVDTICLSNNTTNCCTPWDKKTHIRTCYGENIVATYSSRNIHDCAYNGGLNSSSEYSYGGRYSSKNFLKEGHIIGIGKGYYYDNCTNIEKDTNPPIGTHNP